MNRNKFHIGLRTVKTALAVSLSLLAARLLGSTLPIFAAIGAISVMSRTFSDSLQECLTQLAGTLIGVFIASVFVLLLPQPSFFVFMGCGTLLVILLCLRLRINFAIPLGCIVFADICLFTGSGSPVVYGLHRFTDTVVGLVVALLVNLFIKPYNNHARISTMLTHIQESFPGYLSERVLFGRYADLSALSRSLRRLDEELTLFERQTLPHDKAARQQEAAYLRGCQQLARRMYEELSALCAMDVPGAANADSLARLEGLGLPLPSPLPEASHFSEQANIVLNYHLRTLLDAYDYLSVMNPPPQN